MHREDCAWWAQVAQPAHMLTLSRWAVSLDAAILHTSVTPPPISASLCVHRTQTITPKEGTALLPVREDSSQITKLIGPVSRSALRVQWLSMELPPSAALWPSFAGLGFSATIIPSCVAHVRGLCPSAILSPSSASTTAHQLTTAIPEGTSVSSTATSQFLSTRTTSPSSAPLFAHWAPLESIALLLQCAGGVVLLILMLWTPIGSAWPTVALDSLAIP